MMILSVLLAIQFALVVAYHEATNSIAAGERILHGNSKYKEKPAKISQLVLNSGLVVSSTDSIANGTDENNDKLQNQFVLDLPNFDWLNLWLNGSWLTDTGHFLQNFGRNVSNECMRDLQRMADAHAAIAAHLTISSIRFFTDRENSVSEAASSDQHLWALKMINSFGVHTPGIFHQGQFLLYGSYAQCIETIIPHEMAKTKSRKKRSPQFAQYCMLTIQNPLKETKENRHLAEASHHSYPSLKYGSCWPPSCVREGNNVIAGKIGFAINFAINEDDLVVIPPT
uniref:Nose resistant-to-fluoxetine protein N-terminal domain-containing protein n=1 Tax=Romanomermis culicivorax TaxID=13658 RepID=A0A915JKZ0_ROMCU